MSEHEPPLTSGGEEPPAGNGEAPVPSEAEVPASVPVEPGDLAVAENAAPAPEPSADESPSDAAADPAVTCPPDPSVVSAPVQEPPVAAPTSDSSEGSAPAQDAPAVTPTPDPSAEPAPAPADTPRTVVSGRADFAASLETFHGPLDLLLFLIKGNEVDITNIPIALVLDQYLKFLDAAQDLDLHMAGEFLVMATTLMEIKSRELLPVQEVLEGEELIEDPRSELVRQLLRYRQLKERARFLESRMDLWQRQRSRGLLDEIPEPAPDEAEPLPMPDIDLYELLTLFERLRKSVLAQVPRAVGYDGESLEEKLVRIERTLAERPFTRFSELVADLTSRPDIALTFIALLELVRRRMIHLMQQGAFGNLDVKVQTPEEAEELARNEAVAAESVVDIAFREKAEREAKLSAEAAAMGVAVDQLPWKARRAALARPKFEGIVRPEDLEELDAEEAEISRRIDAILAAADAISQRFEDSRVGQVLPQDGGPLSAALLPLAPEGGSAQGTPDGGETEDAGVAADDDDRPLTEDDLAPRPERPPEPEGESGG